MLLSTVAIVFPLLAPKYGKSTNSGGSIVMQVLERGDDEKDLSNPFTGEV